MLLKENPSSEVPGNVMEFRVFVVYETGAIASFCVFTINDFYDTLMSLSGVSAVTIFKIS